MAQVYSFALYETRAHHAAEDVTEQVFLQALRGLPAFDDRGLDEGSTFRAWLFQICRNVLANERRRDRRHPQAPLELALDVPAADDPAATVATRDEAARAWRVIEGLPADRRQALTLRFVEEMSAREIGEVDGPLGGRRAGAHPSGAAEPWRTSLAGSVRDRQPGRGCHPARPVPRPRARGIARPRPTSAEPDRRRTRTWPIRSALVAAAPSGFHPSFRFEERLASPPAGRGQRPGRAPRQAGASWCRSRPASRPLPVADAPPGQACWSAAPSHRVCPSRPSRGPRPSWSGAVLAGSGWSDARQPAVPATPRLVPARPLDPVPVVRRDALQQAAREERSGSARAAATTSGCGPTRGWRCCSTRTRGRSETRA